MREAWAVFFNAACPPHAAGGGDVRAESALAGLISDLAPTNGHCKIDLVTHLPAHQKNSPHPPKVKGPLTHKFSGSKMVKQSAPRLGVSKVSQAGWSV